MIFALIGIAKNSTCQYIIYLVRGFALNSMFKDIVHIRKVCFLSKSSSTIMFPSHNTTSFNYQFFKHMFLVKES